VRKTSQEKVPEQVEIKEVVAEQQNETSCRILPEPILETEITKKLSMDGGRGVYG